MEPKQTSSTIVFPCGACFQAIISQTCAIWGNNLVVITWLAPSSSYTTHNLSKSSKLGALFIGFVYRMIFPESIPNHFPFGCVKKAALQAEPHRKATWPRANYISASHQFRHVVLRHSGVLAKTTSSGRNFSVKNFWLLFSVADTWFGDLVL